VGGRGPRVGRDLGAELSLRVHPTRVRHVDDGDVVVHHVGDAQTERDLVLGERARVVPVEVQAVAEAEVGEPGAGRRGDGAAREGARGRPRERSRRSRRARRRRGGKGVTRGPACPGPRRRGPETAQRPAHRGQPPSPWRAAAMPRSRPGRRPRRRDPPGDRRDRRARRYRPAQGGSRTPRAIRGRSATARGSRGREAGGGSIGPRCRGSTREGGWPWSGPVGARRVGGPSMQAT
jgi:hypothetical protein